MSTTKTSTSRIPLSVNTHVTTKAGQGLLFTNLSFCNNITNEWLLKIWDDGKFLSFFSRREAPFFFVTLQRKQKRRENRKEDIPSIIFFIYAKVLADWKMSFFVSSFIVPCGAIGFSDCPKTFQKQKTEIGFMTQIYLLFKRLRAQFRHKLVKQCLFLKLLIKSLFVVKTLIFFLLQ